MKKPKENCHIVAYKKNYRAQIESLQEFTSYFVEFLDKADLDANLTKKLISSLGQFRTVFLSKGRDNRNSYFKANDQIENLLTIVELLKDKININNK